MKFQHVSTKHRAASQFKELVFVSFVPIKQYGTTMQENGCIHSVMSPCFLLESILIQPQQGASKCFFSPWPDDKGRGVDGRWICWLAPKGCQTNLGQTLGRNCGSARRNKNHFKQGQTASKSQEDKDGPPCRPSQSP